MEIKAVHPEAGQVEGLVVSKAYQHAPGYALDGPVAGLCLNFDLCRCGRVERYTTAAGVEDKIERVGKLAQPGFQGNDTAGQHPKTESRNMFSWCRGKDFLCGQGVAGYYQQEQCSNGAQSHRLFYDFLRQALDFVFEWQVSTDKRQIPVIGHKLIDLQQT
jgi:hypothetical protein